MFCPQSLEAQIELEEIADLKLQIITPQSSAPIIAMKQDQVIGMWNLTSNNFELDWRTSMNLLSGLELDTFNNIPKNKNFLGRDIFTYLIPKKINILKGDSSNPSLLIKNGKLEVGAIGNDSIGVNKKNSIIQLVWDEYGVEKTRQLLDNITRLATNFNLLYGMTFGIRDIYVSTNTFEQMKMMMETKKLHVLHEISELENNPDMMDEDLFEKDINSRLGIIRDDVGKLIVASSEDNNFMTLMKSGSNKKCNPITLAQISGCVGQQDFHGGRMKKNYNDRALPYFFKNDDRAESRGFIEKSFLTGLNLPDFIFHHLSSREGLIDQTVRSVTPDTKIVIMENSKPKIVEIGSWIDGQLDPINLTNPELIERDRNNFELLKVKNIQIPTVDESGNVTWGEVTAITRHDPGAQLFEIVTRGGRKVIVPESKSLLIWNSQTEKFEDKITPEVVLGDFVPVTMNLPNPSVISRHIDMTEYFPKREYLYGTDFFKAKEEIEKAMEGRDKIPAGWWDRSNGTLFTLPYENKGRFQRVQSGRSDISNIKQGYFYSFSTSRDSSIPEKFELNKINGQFIGLFIADGDADWNGGHIRITKSDERVLKFVEDYFKSMDIKYERNKRVTDRGTINDVRGFSRIFAKFLDNFVGHGAINKYIPEIAYTAPEEFIIGLIDGFISGDGCVESNSITASSCSEKLIDGLNILFAKIGIFAKKSVYTHKNDNREIKANYDAIKLSIRAQWAHKFKSKIGTLINGDKNTKLENMKPSEQLHPNFKSHNDIVLDEIKEINPIPVSRYKKLYDLTVPSTLNFIIFNGMGCRDTAESGYIQRKLIKATEDMMVNYDGTVRNAVGRILQFQYGDSGADTVKQYEYKFKLMEMGNEEVGSKYGMSKEELGRVKGWSESDNKDFIKLMISIRDNLRKTQIKTTMNYLTLSTSYMLPVNLNRILDNFRNGDNSNKTVCTEPKFIIDLIKEILEPYNTRLYCMTENEMKDKNSVKYQDDQVAKTAFGYALTDLFAPKKCIFQYKLSKEQLGEIKNEIIKSFNKSIVEPGEMVGIIAAQSLGEPVTQLMLNSLDWEQEIMIHNKETNVDEIIPIGKFIDELILIHKSKVTNPIDNLEAEMRSIFYLDTTNMDYYIKSVDENGKVSWKHIEAVTKHLPINRDGTDTLIKVTTRTGKSVIATKGKSFLTQKDNKIIPIRGDEIGVGDYLPVMTNYPEICTHKYFDLTKYFSKEKYIYGTEIQKAKEIKKSNNENGIREWFKNYNGKEFTTPYSRQDSLKRVFDDNIDYRVGCIYPTGAKTNSHLPEKIVLDKDFGFLIGAYLAEGSLSKTQICISNNDESYRNNIIKFCEKYSIGYHITREDKENIRMATCDKYEIRLHSTMLAEVFLSICGKLSHNKFVPSFAFNSDIEFIKGLLDGYFSGDGTVYCNKSTNYISATSVSKKLLEGVSLLLTRFGILTKLTTNKLVKTNNLGTKNPKQSYTISIRNKNIHKFYDNVKLTITSKQEKIKKLSNYKFMRENGFIENIPSVKLTSINKTSFNKNELISFMNNTTNVEDKNIVKSLLEYDVFMDAIVSIEEVRPTHTYVYDFTVADTKNFIISNGLCVRDSFHASGVGGKGGTNIGVDRIKEVFSLSKNPKDPRMEIYLDAEHRTKKDFANKIASHIKFTTIKDLRTKIEIFHDPEPYEPDGIVAKDNVGTPFYTYQSNKQCCSNSIDGLPWLMRIEFDREKLLTKEVSLLDIKSQFCFAWERRYTDIKGMKREKKQLIDKISQLAVQSNTDNDDIPILHIRFDMNNFTQSTLVDFMDMFVDEFKLKGMPDIDDVRPNGKAIEERILSFGGEDQTMEKNSEYVIYTRGINMEAIKNIVGIDLNRTYCNDIITIYENFGIEAARNHIIREIISVLTSNGSETNYQHIEIFGDLMTQVGTLTSIDRFGLNKLDTDPLSRASFEKTVDQLITAAIFNEVDYMKSVSSRIMAGLCIKGGTGLCSLVLDKDLLENSEYTIDIGQLYHKTYKDITSTLQTQELDEDVFIPEM